MSNIENLSEQANKATLTELGARVRAWRARRGVTRKALASDSGLSERFLADVESGKGNVSINSLEAAARALNISILELLQDAPRPALARVQGLLSRLDDTQLDQAYALLGSTFGLSDALGREQRIALIGLRGAGKSTLGLKLATERGVPFVELDREIEREAGTSMNEILLLHGQAGYRRYERRALFRIAEDHADGVVMTTGGSIVSERETFDLLQSRFYCVWLKASPEEHMARVVAQGDMRPFTATRGATDEAMEDLRRILASREALYARADAVVDTAARTLKQSLKDLERAVPQTTVRAEPVEALRLAQGERP
ncbi:MAG: helix-turn-helix transcriptional regulator [Polaromonas sp.]|uniref:helix-turn-helix transcriptional regulator n=1 Tax=Polaromonas sp. TaxID=1869339 RepID=UPI0027319F40|nr:helix-turn-helix transcriptional regulator [Polaromonas sp.]MDP2449723.1 helix-turn-helix transcriptional regulator [Polaromonas sp.]MDP3245667.1 helix-turn-helix transcriptional regulator [Polaromonas sp.]MDP3754842.1 helix-turn-helix transcriptional regulator [Polaromonas sp.]MDP3825419.1 helix-turn-helix transcriptional regulator [Polaromonas sp.]